METMPKPKRYLTKSKREITGRKAGAKASVQTAPSADNGLSLTLDTPSQAETQTQAAVRLFLRRIEKIADAQIVLRGNGEIYRLGFVVEVPDLWSEAADQVYTLRGDVYRKYPDAQIEIEVRGRREYGNAVHGMGLGEEQ